MNKSQYFKLSRNTLWMIVAILFLGALWQLSVNLQAQSSAGSQLTANAESEALLNGYRHVEVASVSDAMEQLMGRKMYLSHKMQPIFPAKFAGFALTVKLSKDEGNKDPAALSGMLAAIDQGTQNSVWVMVVEDGADIAGMGGLMGTAMSARGYSGAIIDGGVRDVGQLRKIGFPVYATGIVPSTSVGHYRFAGADVPVTCAGVEVKPGDIVAADGDGVVIVPRANAKEVLALAQEMDFKEHSMYPIIEKYKSIQEAVKRFGRL
jgi:regulator of RNase E activity RraA